MIDIIIPHLNFGKYLRQCLESIRKQNVEKTVYLIDGGSTDNTFEVLEDFPEVNVFKVQGKVKEAFNYGVDYSYGDFIVCFGSDNLMLPGFLESAQKLLESDRDMGMVYGDSIGINENNKILGKTMHGGPYNLARLKRGNYIDFSEGLFRREAWITHAFPDWLVYHLDWFIWLKISETWKIGWLGFPAILYRLHSDSLSTRKHSEIQREYLMMLQKINHHKI